MSSSRRPVSTPLARLPAFLRGPLEPTRESALSTLTGATSHTHRICRVSLPPRGCSYAPTRAPAPSHAPGARPASLSVRALEHVGRRPAPLQPPRGGSRLVPRRYPDPDKPVGRLPRQSHCCSLSWSRAPPSPPRPHERKAWRGPNRAYSRLVAAAASHGFRRRHWLTGCPTLRHRSVSGCESEFPCGPIHSLPTPRPTPAPQQVSGWVVAGFLGVAVPSGGSKGSG